MGSSRVIEVNGKPTMDLHYSDDCSDGFSPLRFQLRKAQLILELVDDIQAFVDEYAGEEEEKAEKAAAKVKVLSGPGAKTKPKKSKKKTSRRRKSEEDDE